MGQTVDVAAHFGFVTRWKLIGPFENTKESGYDVAYGPEKDLNPSAEYAGRGGMLKWIDHQTQDQYGNVDLNAALGKHKGAIAYAYSEFLSDRDQDAELRLGCITGNKLWLNGSFAHRQPRVPCRHLYRSVRRSRAFEGRQERDPAEDRAKRADGLMGPGLEIPAARLRSVRHGHPVARSGGGPAMSDS